MKVAQQGFALVLLLVVLVLAAVFSSWLLVASAQNQQGSAMQLQVQQAELAANSGLQWLQYELLRQQQCNPVLHQAPLTGPTVAPYQVQVSCELATAATGQTVYQLYSIATVGTVGDINYIRRERHSRVLASGI